MEYQSQYLLNGNNELLSNQNYESGQVFGKNYQDGNISSVNGLSQVNIDQYNLTDYSQSLNNKVTVPEFSTYNTNNIQLKPISYDNNSYLYNFQNTNYNNYPLTNSIKYTGTKKKSKEHILILPLYLSGYQYIATKNQSNYLSQATSYDTQPKSILVNYEYGDNNTIDNNQYITSSTNFLATSFEQNQNNLNNFSLQNGYVANYNNTQLQNAIETYPNDFYAQNKNVNIDPYCLTQSYDNNKIYSDSYNITPNYNTYNLNQPIEETISQPYKNNLNTVYKEDNSNLNNLGVIRSSNKHIDSAHLIKSMPISKNSHNRISLPPVVIIPRSKKEYTPIKMKRYIQKVKPLGGKRQKVIIPAYDNAYNISNNNNFIITEQNNNTIPITQNIIISENNSNYIPSNDNYVTSENTYNYIQNTENALMSVQENNYTQNSENAVMYGQENNNALITENNIIYGQENNFIPNTENAYISGQESNYPSTNDSNNNSISRENNLYLQTPKINRTTNIILPPRKSFIEKPISFRTPIKKVSHKKYFSTGVRATSPLRYSGEDSTNFVSLSPIKTPIMENGLERINSPLI